MKKPIISLIVAMSENHVIGQKGGMPWNIPGELKRFKEITNGHPIIMGRKTHESIGRVLPNRLNIIITRDREYKVEGALVVHSLDKAIRQVKDEAEVFIIGGGEIFKQAMPIADRLYVTIIHKHIDGDTFFPDYSEFTNVIFHEDRREDGHTYTLLELERPVLKI